MHKILFRINRRIKRKKTNPVNKKRKQQYLQCSRKQREIEI